jgi:uncharacterized protein Usg
MPFMVRESKMSAVRQRLQESRLTTAEIFFHSADNPDNLQSLIWQDYDMAPDYPELRKFLTYWSRHIDSTVHSVQVVADRMPRRTAEKYPQLSTAVH